MADCTYRMKDAAGAWQTITGKPAMMAALADGRLDHLLPAGVVKAMGGQAPAGEARQDAEDAGAREQIEQDANRQGLATKRKGASSQSVNSKDADAAEAKRVQDAIEGKSLIDAARFMTQSSDKAKAAVAGAVMNKLERLQAAGVKLELNIAHRGDMVPAPLHSSRGFTETGFDEKGRDIAVWLNGADVAGKVGTDEETLLHELVHAATTGMVFYGKSRPDTLAGQHVRALMAVTDAIAAHISQRFEDSDAGKATLTDFERDMREGYNNAFRSDDEVLAWALSSRDAQTYLEGIPYKSGSMWSRFVSAVRTLLGLSPQQDTALSEVLAVAERLMTDDAPEAGRAAFWHKRGMRMVQQQGRGSIVQTKSGVDPKFSRAPKPLPDTLTIDGVDRPTTNSKGLPIHPTEEGVRNFWEWFGDSKVIDGQGRPLVVYHGTPENGLTEITPGYSEPGAWFTENYSYAAEYSKGPEGEIFETYLSMKNPLVVSFDYNNGELVPIANGEVLAEPSKYDPDEMAPLSDNIAIVKYAQRKGHDGVIFPGGNFTEESAAYVSFDSTKIKSATGNTGAFGAQSPDIRFSNSPDDPAPAGITYDTLPAAFAKRFPKLEGAVKTMLHRGALGRKGGLVVLDTNDGAQIAREFASRTGWDYRETMEMFESVDGAGVHGIYDPKTGTIFAVGPNLDEASLPAVILHESIHGQQRASVDTKAQALLEGRAKEAPALRAFLDRVAVRMEEVGETGNRFEVAPYIVEMAVTEGRKAGFSAADGPILAWIEKNIGRKAADLVRDFVATLRAWALAHGVPLKSVAVDDLVAYAMAGVGRAARGEVVTLGKAVASKGGTYGKIGGMDDANNVAGKQAPTPAGDDQAGGEKFIAYSSDEADDYLDSVKDEAEESGRRVFFHVSPEKNISSIQTDGGQKADFGGLFALENYAPGQQDHYGKYLHEITIDADARIATEDDIRELLESGDYDYLLSGYSDDENDISDLRELVADGMSRFIGDEDAASLLSPDPNDDQWVAQTLRAKVAKDAGFAGLAEEDGTLIFPGDDVSVKLSRVQPEKTAKELNEPPASASSDASPKFSRSAPLRAATKAATSALNKFSPSGQAALGTLTADQQAAVERVFGKPKTLAERAEAFAKDWKKNLVQGVFDQFAPIKEISSKGYMLARLAKGGDSTLEAMLMYGKVSVDGDGVYQVDFDGQNLKGFASAMAKLDGEHDRFLAWVSGQRAERLAGVGLENLMTAQDITALKTLADGSTASGKVRRALYAEALKELNAFNDSVLKIAADSGLIDEATRAMYRDTPYVPFYRLSEEDVVQGPSVSKGLVNQSAWKQLKGGTDKLNEDLMGNLLKNWSHLITASANNRAAKEVLDTAARMGAATDMTNDVVAQDINGQPIYRGNTKGLVRYRGEIKRKIPAGQPYIENGQALISDGTAEIAYVGDRYFRVDDPHLMDAIASIGFTTKVWKPMADFKRYLTFGVTVNPTFKIRNLIRDSIQAVGTAELSYNPVKNILMGAKGTEMMSNMRAQMMASGGMLRFGSSEGAYSGHVRRLIEKGVDPQYILDNDSKVKAFWKHKVLPAFEAYQELGDRSENVNRAALYEQLLAKGMSHAEASFWARDMMDFSMHGKWAAIRTLTAVVPFMNARLQGIYKLGRATKADYRRMGATLAAVSVASMALMLAYGDDDDWKKREDWDRDNSWWFKIGDTAFRIPKPFEVGAVGTIAERSLELMISDEMTGKRFGQRMRDLLMQNLSMNPTPQLVKPMIDLYANKDGFSGRDIETQGMEKMRPEDRYTARTSEVARFLGQLGLPNPAQLLMGRVEGLSPVQIDHLIRGYFSWVGTSATNVLDRGIRPMMDRGEQPDMRLRDMFLAGNFVETLPSGSSRYVTQFYEQAKEVEQMYASYRQALKEGDAEKAQEIRDENPEGFAARRRIEAAKRAESLISGQMRTIERDRAMTGEEKRARLDQLENRRDEIARRALLVPAAAGRD